MLSLLAGDYGRSVGASAQRSGARFNPSRPGWGISGITRKEGEPEKMGGTVCINAEV